MEKAMCELISISSLLLIVCLLHAGDAALRFPHSYSDHMVLQRAPQRAILWGYADHIGSTVTAFKNDVNEGSTTVQRDPHNATQGIWKLKLHPEVHTNRTHVIKVTSDEGTITLHDVLFGDVWLCSGQSNMQLALHAVNDSAHEINESLKYRDIRMIHSQLIESNATVQNVATMHQWLPPTKGTIDRFSGLCYLYAKEIHKATHIPIGLIESDWGGTPIEYWSSPDAKSVCHWENQKSSCLWNAMIYPYTSMTITGAIWYQGEANAGHPDLYACQFPAMITDWRHKFHNASDGETSDNFAFGFVQLAPWRPEDRIAGWPPTRWAQTAKIGYVPNDKMPNTFMASAVDLPDFNSPSGSIHPRYKQDIAIRLALGARNLVYHEKNLQFKAPFPSSYHLNTSTHSLEITFDSSAITVKINKGFEVCCANLESSACSAGEKWVTAPISNSHGAVVAINTTGCAGISHVAGVRYLWRESPCSLKECAIYSNAQHLPVPPFIQTGGFSHAPEIIG